MISSEVQRTLVKSPPELWAELSDPTALARHLGELGEIRIVRTEPERVVEWAAEHTTGVVSIKPSGWGTRVTLSATREQAAEPEIAGATLQEPAVERKAGEEAAEPDTAPQAQSGAQPDLAAEPQAGPDPDMAAEPQSASQLDTTAEPEPQPAAESEPGSTAVLEAVAAEPDSTPVGSQSSEPEPRRGFFARLFRRRPRTEPSPAVQAPPERPDAFAAVRHVLAPETFAAMHPFAAQTAAAGAAPATQSVPKPSSEPEPQMASQPGGEPSTDIAAELMAAEDVTADEVSAAEVTAVLTAVLDRLGAAHHRPFSRG
jgi:hypothetical protein